MPMSGVTKLVLAIAVVAGVIILGVGMKRTWQKARTAVHDATRRL